MKLRLILDVEYTPNSTSEDLLRTLLTNISYRAVNRGEVTGETDAEVNHWDMRVHRVDEEETCGRDNSKFE